MPICRQCQQEYPDAVSACPACGTAQPKRIQQTEYIGAVSMLRFVQAFSGREIPLTAGEWIIGRADSDYRPDIDLTPFGAGPGQGVSRKHARVIVQGNGASIEDLKSTNGTLLNGKLLPPQTLQRLDDGDRLDMGNVSLIFRTS
jgi:pSer/pThr/pTyr-binding forkhead associated (FHA) protein